MKKMKFIDLLRHVKKGGGAIEQSTELYGLMREFGLSNNDFDYSKFYDDEKFKEYLVIPRYDSDYYIGLSAVYFDGELVGSSLLHGRKCDTEYSWISLEAFNKVKAYAETLVLEDELKPDIISAEDLEEETAPTFKISFSSCLLTKRGIYQGKECNVQRTSGFLSKDLIITDDEGASRVVDCKDVDLLMNINF